MAFDWKPKIRFRYVQVGKNKTKAQVQRGLHITLSPHWQRVWKVPMSIDLKNAVFNYPVYVTHAYRGFLLYGMDWYKKLSVFYVANTEVLKYVQRHSTKCKKVDKTAREPVKDGRICAI
jgi:hypothetical protein